MNKNRIIYERAAVLDGILEIAIPKMFNRVFFQDNDKNEQSYVAWTNNNNESIIIYQLEPNQYALRDIMEAARMQMVTEEQELNNLGAYSCVSNGIEKFMSEDEIVVDGTDIYIISCVLRCKDMSFVIYYTGNAFVKSSIKENMLYILDSISFIIREDTI